MSTKLSKFYRKIEPKSFEQVNNLTNEELFICNRCGALVVWTDRHYNFHKVADRMDADANF